MHECMFCILRQCRSLLNKEKEEKEKKKKKRTMDNNGIHHEATKWERYAKEKKLSMKRRCEQNDYHDRRIYMITMAIEGRQPLLGTIRGKSNITEGDQAPHVDLSPLGKKVKECWMKIPFFHPQVKPIKLCIMPDHIHGVLFVTEKMDAHLGIVVNGFKTGTRKAALELGAISSVMPQSNRHGQLWETGYNDRILTHEGQLQRMLSYLDDNPRRLLIKREHPEFFRQLGTITVAGTPMQAMGNRFLLDNPVKIQVQCSRSLTLQEIEQQKRFFLNKGNSGAILVSPCISPGEQQIATAALHAHIPLIVLLLKGLSPYFKPQSRYLEACSEGLLLILALYPFQNEKLYDMRSRCLHLNSLAATICEEEHPTIDCSPIKARNDSILEKKC